MANVVLFGGGLQTLSLARGLKQHNNEIVSIGDSHSVGKFSRYVDKFVVFDITKDTLEALIEYIKKWSIEVIIPTEDEYAKWLSDNKNIIESATNAKCAVVGPALFNKVINKSLLIEECKKANVPHPKTLQITGSNIIEVAAEIEFPALIKPDVSNGSRGICKVDNIHQLSELSIEITKQFGSCSLQEFIDQPGHYYNVMLYRYNDGEFGPYVATKITRFYPIKGGSSSFCTTIKDDKLVEICKTLLDHLKWSGFADFDVLEKGSGDYRIIEINPRVPASLHAALVSGIDFGQMIVDDLISNKRNDAIYTPGEQLRFLGLDIAWFLSSPNRFRVRPSWFKFFGKHMHYQEGGLKDFKAMVYSILQGIRKQMSPSFRKAKAGMN